jgi:hypothetical protein
VCAANGIVPALLQVPLVELYTSELVRMPDDADPPATRTRPSARQVIEKSSRAVAMLPVDDHVLCVGSKSSAVATSPAPALPPATRTLPLARVQAPNKRRADAIEPTAVQTCVLGLYVSAVAVGVLLPG